MSKCQPGSQIGRKKEYMHMRFVYSVCILAYSGVEGRMHVFCLYPVVSCSQSCILAFEGGYTHISVSCCILTCIPMYS